MTAFGRKRSSGAYKICGHSVRLGETAMRSLLLLFLGIPIPIIILLAIFVF